MDNKTPYIQKAVLIDDRRIELYWNTQVRRADCEKNFLVKYAGEKRELFHWTSNMEWSLPERKHAHNFVTFRTGGCQLRIKADSTGNR